MPKVVTANLLSSGTVVFLGRDGAWIDAIDQALAFADAADAETGLTAARLDEKRALIVEPFIVDMAGEGAGRASMSLRNAIRAHGPTIHYLPAARTSAA